MSQEPSVGRNVHYVSYGTPGGEYKSECRAAIVTEVQPGIKGERAVIDVERVGLCVLNPTGMSFHSIADGGCKYHDGTGQPGASDCRTAETHGAPFRYCPCGWSEDAYRAGTWHWPERVGDGA